MTDPDAKIISMAKHSEFGEHRQGVRLDGVLHMCPECGIKPRASCPCCHGAGSVSEAELARWVRIVNAAVLL
jgi:hypothetical protein